MGEIYFPVSIAGLDEYLYCMETLISADPSKIPLLGDALVIAGTVFFAFSNVGEVSSPMCICCNRNSFTFLIGIPFSLYV